MPAMMHRNVLLLALCQALFMTGSSMVVTVTALAGESLAPDSGLGTLPFALQFVMTMASTLPASLTMRRLGRRAGFTVGAGFGVLGGGLGVLALQSGDFPLFCLGSAAIGVLNGFSVHYRFAAADCADEARRAKAISLVMAGGVLAAFTGPNLARATVHAFPGAAFAGTFAALAALQVLTVTVLAFTTIPRLSAQERRESGRPATEILAKPKVIVAILGGIAGYSSMTLVMTATPLAVTGFNHAFSDAAFVIQWHVFAMFAPGFATGHLIRRFGPLPVIASGAVLIFGCFAVNISGTEIVDFTIALMALGFGWNFMFTGATALLTASVTRAEQAKIQGINDAFVFGSVAMAALGAGALFTNVGWTAVNMAVLPGIGLALTATLWLLARRAPEPA